MAESKAVRSLPLSATGEIASLADVHTAERARPIGPLREFGFSDRTDLNIGLMRNDVSFGLTINPATGGKVYFCRFDYPVRSGDHLAYVLEAISPVKCGKFIKNTIGDDWNLPEDAAMGPNFASKLHQIHQEHIPAYGEFAESSRIDWIRRIKDGNTFEPQGVFGFLVSTAFIQPETFAKTQFSTWRDEYEQWKRKSAEGEEMGYHPAISLLSPRDIAGTNRQLREFIRNRLEEDESQAMKYANIFRVLQRDARSRLIGGYLPERFADSYFEVVQENIAHAPIDLQINILLHNYLSQDFYRLIDPATGKTWKIDYGDIPTPGDEVEVPILGGEVVTLLDQDVTARISLAGVSDQGTYVQNDAQFSFGGGYHDGAIYPLLAWEVGPDGNRSFVDQQTALRILPDYLKQPRLDLFLGETMLAYMAGTTFPKEMKIPKIPETAKTVKIAEGQRSADSDALEIYRSGILTKTQRMRAPQMPVLISHAEGRVLGSKGVKKLEQHIDSFVSTTH